MNTFKDAAGVLIWRLLLVLVIGGACAKNADALEVYVDGESGLDSNLGTRSSPLRSIAAAMAKIPTYVTEDYVIHVGPGTYSELDAGLTLQKKLRAKATVRIVGERAGFSGPAAPGKVIFDWAGAGAGANGFLVRAREGSFTLENIQLGSGRIDQQSGVEVLGPARLLLRNVRIETGSPGGAAMRVMRGGHLDLQGNVEVNLAEQSMTGSTRFAPLEVFEGGYVEFADATGHLWIGNGSVEVRDYATFRLSAGSLRVTSHSRTQSALATLRSAHVHLVTAEATITSTAAGVPAIRLDDEGFLDATQAKLFAKSAPGQIPIVLERWSMLRGEYVETLGSPAVSIDARHGSSALVSMAGAVGNLQAAEFSQVRVHRFVKNSSNLSIFYGSAVTASMGEVTTQTVIEEGFNEDAPKMVCP